MDDKNKEAKEEVDWDIYNNIADKIEVQDDDEEEENEHIKMYEEDENNSYHVNKEDENEDED